MIDGHKCFGTDKAGKEDRMVLGVGYSFRKNDQENLI